MRQFTRMEKKKKLQINGRLRVRRYTGCLCVNKKMLLISNERMKSSCCGIVWPGGFDLSPQSKQDFVANVSGERLWVNRCGVFNFYTDSKANSSDGSERILSLAYPDKHLQSRFSGSRVSRRHRRALTPYSCRGFFFFAACRREAAGSCK